VQFEELISLDPDSIRSLSPVYGVIFLFKWVSGVGSSGGGGSDNNGNGGGNQGTPPDGSYDPSATDNGLFFAAQTIQNACGTQAVLSVILNQDDSPSQQQQSNTSDTIDIGSELRSFKDFTTGFPPDLRGEALSNSAVIRTAHNAFARASPFVDESAPAPEEKEAADLYHFIAYIPYHGTLYELDGLQPFPISHGSYNTAPDAQQGDFAERVIEVLQRRIARYPGGEIRFNLMAAVRDLRLRATELGDTELLERERRKRRAWAWENSLRRCNFVGFIGEITKGVVRRKCAAAAAGDEGGGYEKWIDEAKQETRRKLEMRRGRKAGGEEAE
jgi:ubiquitin carboxyl-terminal hydrolase L5